MWIHHKPSAPCPLCNGTTDCRLNGLTNLTHCRRADKHSPPAGWRYIKDDSIGFGMFAPDLDEAAQRNADARGGMSAQAHQEITDARRLKAERRAEKRQAVAVSSKLEEIRRNMRPMTLGELDAIATLLILPMGVFSVLDVQFLPDDGYGRFAWVFPERSGSGAIIGYTLRYRDGTKRNHGHRGLSIPSQRSNNDPASPIFLVEGASDTLSLVAMDMNVVGRPSNTGGVDHLAQLLRGVNRPIIIVGENDQRADPDNADRIIWPGRDGADSTAQKLAIALGRPVYASMPPAAVKDSREIIKAYAPAIRAKESTLAAVGERYTAHLVAAAVPFSPQPHAPAPTSAASLAVVDGSSSSVPVAVPTLPSIPFRAIDCLPAPDVMPPAEIKRCPTPKGVILSNVAKGLSRVQWFDCKKLGCPYCDGIKRQQYQATVQTHLEDLARHHTDHTVDPSVHLFWVNPQHWETVRRGLRGKPDEPDRYFKLDCESLLLVISADASPKSAFVSQAEQVSTDEASRRLCSAIDRLPKLREKAFTTSRAWKLVGHDKKKTWPDWKRVGKVGATQTAIWEILEYHRIDFKPNTHRGMFWSWQAWQWTDAQAHGKRQQTFDDIEAGEILPSDSDIDATFGGGIGEFVGELVGAARGQPGDDGTFW